MNRKLIQNSNYVLRTIFHSNSCLEILKNFIESFLELKIKNIKINETPLIDGKPSKEYGIIDVRILAKDGQEYNVGIQVVDGNYIQSKMFLYYAKIHSNQILYDDNRKIARTITINILDIAYFSSSQYHKVINIKTNIIDDNIIETMQLHVIELPKYIKRANKTISPKEEWIIYFQGKDKKTIKKIKNRNEQINKLDELIEKYWKEEKI